MVAPPDEKLSKKDEQQLFFFYWFLRCFENASLCILYSASVDFLRLDYCDYFDYSFADIDECQIGEHDCHENAICVDDQGGYACSCHEGFSGNGTSCTGKNNRIFDIFDFLAAFSKTK